ncbi:hypothetical protein AMK26_11890 [Streptomyces sp. CB03234]|uniref:hypothetical protein n=1 Tax=Streptomyces sp. (strain CB03234) TaxID=1703937 RepID=UPI00093DC6A2|nr:hypothetical protein [Streptomyces sp. CB03234]OKK06684.1 hypothetical protein AMK26_11890 [Streptomyces sp. CB03234]
MFAYELQQARHADLLREADAQRLANVARAARKARRALARRSGHNAPEGQVNTDHGRFATAA